MFHSTKRPSVRLAVVLKPTAPEACCCDLLSLYSFYLWCHVLFKHLRTQSGNLFHDNHVTITFLKCLQCGWVQVPKLHGSGKDPVLSRNKSFNPIKQRKRAKCAISQQQALGVMGGFVFLSKNKAAGEMGFYSNGKYLEYWGFHNIRKSEHWSWSGTF